MIIKFHKKIYSKKSIDESIRAFSGLAEFAVSSEENNYRVEIGNIDSAVAKNFSAEFANYVLSNLQK